MKYYTFQPGPKLAPYVRAFWVLEGAVTKEQPYIHRTLASFCPEIIFHYSGSFEELAFGNDSEKSFLTGIHAQTRKFRRFIVKESFGIFGVLLEPYALHALLGIPSGKLVDEMPDLYSVIGQEGKDLEEKIMLAGSNERRLHIITSFLEKRLTVINRPEIIGATNTIYKSKGQLNLKKLADQSCLSQRQFERKFKELNGFTPKLFSRIVRFNALLNTNLQQYRSLTEMAYDFGYYDQAHFIQDFKEFSGYNPAAYFTGRADEVFFSW